MGRSLHGDSTVQDICLQDNYNTIPGTPEPFAAVCVTVFVMRPSRSPSPSHNAISQPA
jgi:hypothetical protein